MKFLGLCRSQLSLPAMNDSSRVLIVLMSGLILVGLTIRNGQLMLLAIPLLIYLMVGLFLAPTEIKLHAHRTMSDRSVVVGELIEVVLKVENRGAQLANLYLDDRPFPSMSIIDGQTAARLPLATGEVTEMAYTVKATRGAYVWSTLHALAGDPFGLFDQAIEVLAPGDLLVRPRPMPIRRGYIRPRATKLSAGSIPARRAGTGSDYWGIREYRLGDSMRRLNWRLAARHPGKLFTNEFEQAEIADFGLILDARRLSNERDMDEALFEASLAAAASMAEIFLRRGNRVSLLVFGHTMNTVFPGFGKHQLDRVHQTLAQAQLGRYIPFEYSAFFPVGLFPTHGQLVIYGSLDGRDLDAYARLRAHDYDVLLISPDPVDYAAKIRSTRRVNSLAYRAARIERVVELKRLLGMGVKVVDWQVNKPIDSVLRAAAKHYPPGRWL